MPKPKPRLVAESETIALREPNRTRSDGPSRSLTPASSPPLAPRLIPGHRLDRYELLCPIAQGGMASVWVARIQGVHGFEKLVAVKTILAEYAADPHYEAMFLDEARIIANIHHHNVAEILDLGSHDSLLYLVLEWIEGDSLALLEHSASKHKRPIPVSVGLRILAQMCAGLNAAHELQDRAGRRLNVVHRDVSPQNVLISVTGEVKLIDFGIAKAQGQMSTDTNTGVLKGKISFMAPEQALGQPLDARADIWSAGVVLYQLLSGKLPFRGGSQLETLHIISARKRAPAIPGLPTLLQRLLDRMLEPERNNRIGSAAELETELECVSALLGVATTRDVASVVQEHRGRRIAARRETIDTALRAADDRQRLTQVFDAAIERARHPDDATPGPFAHETPRVVPSLSLLAAIEPSLVTLAAPKSVRPLPRTPSFAPPSVHASISTLAVGSSTTPPAVAPTPRKIAFPLWLTLAAISTVGAAFLFAVPHRPPAFTAPVPSAPVSAPSVSAKPAPLATASAAPAPATLASAASSVSEVYTPTVQATDLPLAAPKKKPQRYVAHPAPARHDVWSAFSEHR